MAVGEAFGCRVAESIDTILQDDAIDAVLIATTTDTHADLIEAAAAAGKAVFCEKPIDLSLDRVNRCAEAIASADVPIQIGFNRRFDPGHRAVPATVICCAAGLAVTVSGRRWGLAPLAGYAAGVLAASVVVGRELPPQVALRLPATFTAMHGAWGAGFLTSPRRLGDR